jgi:hypothetical protein
MMRAKLLPVSESWDNPILWVCLPRMIRNQQLMDVLIKYLRDNPEQLHQEAGLLTAVAMMKAFPCPKN